MDVNVRQMICKTIYGHIWDEADLETKFDPRKCINCEICAAELVCPMRAIALRVIR
jgi:ferredoxin